MEIQAPTHQEMAKLISHSLKLLLTSLAKATSNTSKLILIDLKYILKSGKSLTLRKIHSLRHNRHTAATALSCRPSDAENYLSTFISPRDYQFSCSSSPIIRRRSKHRSHNYKYNIYHHHNQKQSSHYYNNVTAVEAVDKVLNMLNRGGGGGGDQSPEIELPGFGKSPVIARQLRVTDSPFSLREGVCGDERSGDVDKAAEEFIDRFYNELKLQRNIAPVPVPAAVHGYRDRVDYSYNRTRRT